MRYEDAAIIGGCFCICHTYRINPIGAVPRRVVERPRWLRILGQSNAQCCPIFYFVNVMMTQSLNNGFREYLASSMSSMFALDLSNCTVIECINKMCEIKSRSHPKIKQDYRMLVNKMESIEQQFGCTIMPAMIRL